MMKFLMNKESLPNVFTLDKHCQFITATHNFSFYREAFTTMSFRVVPVPRVYLLIVS